jgi:hypothetical protein
VEIWRTALTREKRRKKREKRKKIGSREQMRTIDPYVKTGYGIKVTAFADAGSLSCWKGSL